MRLLLLFVILLFVGTFAVSDATSPTPSTVKDGAVLSTVFTDSLFFEGPVWDPVGQRLYFTSHQKGGQQILRTYWPQAVTPFMSDTRGINGMFMSNDLKWLLCAQRDEKAIIAVALGKDMAGPQRLLAQNDSWNGPNDLCQVADGGVYFTDPDFKNKTNSAVYYVSPDSTILKVIDDMKVPNGVIASLDGKTLYVSDSADKKWRSYPIKADGTLGAGRDFFKPASESKSNPDGMTIDEQGNLYLTGLGYIWIVNPEGNQLGKIKVDEFCSNVTFGGVDRKTLYITCKNVVYRLPMKVKGKK